MRKLFSEILLDRMQKNENIVFLTADLGYGLWDEIRACFPDRSYNLGSSEQLMLGCATGLAIDKKIPVCYSISPFLIYRPFEFIRNYLDHESIAVKLVGGGRGKDYGHLGFSHWAHDDFKILKSLNNIDLFKPMTESDLVSIADAFLTSKYPAYLNLKK